MGQRIRLQMRSWTLPGSLQNRICIQILWPKGPTSYWTYRAEGGLGPSPHSPINPIGSGSLGPKESTTDAKLELCRKSSNFASVVESLGLWEPLPIGFVGQREREREPRRRSAAANHSLAQVRPLPYKSNRKWFPWSKGLDCRCEVGTSTAEFQLRICSRILWPKGTNSYWIYYRAEGGLEPSPPSAL